MGWWYVVHSCTPLRLVYTKLSSCNVYTHGLRSEKEGREGGASEVRTYSLDQHLSVKFAIYCHCESSHRQLINLLPCIQPSMPPISGLQQLHSSQPHLLGGMAPGIQNMSQPGSPAGGQPGSATSRIDQTRFHAPSQQ